MTSTQQITWILDEGNAATCVEDFGGDGVEAEGWSDKDGESDEDDSGVVTFGLMKRI